MIHTNNFAEFSLDLCWCGYLFYRFFSVHKCLFYESYSSEMFHFYWKLDFRNYVVSQMWNFCECCKKLHTFCYFKNALPWYSSLSLASPLLLLPITVLSRGDIISLLLRIQQLHFQFYLLDFFIIHRHICFNFFPFPSHNW